jgi:gliding motility-associated-like protein
VNSILTCAVTELNLNGIAVGGSQGVSLLWTGPGIVSGNTTNAPTIDAVGNYVLVATDNYNGCVSTDSVLVSNDVTAPTLTIAQPATLTCFLKETPISGAGSSIGGQFTYEWTGPGILTGGQTLQPIVNLPGTYALTITNNSNGCTSTGSTAVAQDVLLPLAAAGGAFELTCSIEQGQLNSTGSSTGNSIRYTWNTTPGGNIVSGATSAMPVVNQAGTYFLTVSDIVTGCTSTASVAVTRNTNYPSEIDFSTENPKCDEQPGEVIFEEIIGGTPPYTYSIDGGVTFGPANQFNTIQPGLYTLYVRDANGCLYKETLSFPVPPEPAVTLSPSVTIAFGANTEITATVLNIPLSEVDTVIWSPMTGITLTNKPNVVIAEPYTDTEYKVTIISEDGCEATATVLVEVADPKIWAPNVFSPGNQDGENDWFYIFSAPNTVKKIHSLQVFDRWGDMLFQNKDIQPNDYKFGWDGRFRGSPMTPAVFVWWAKVELVDGREILMKGDVTIAD